MENYFLNPQKYNKIIYKFLGYEEKMDNEKFCPDNAISGFEILRWVMHKICTNPKEGRVLKTQISIKAKTTRIDIQEWYDIKKQSGFVNIVQCEYGCDLKKEDVSENTYKNEIINVSHIAMYNACVDFILKY